jgi:preprotein translocase subunit SecB
MPNEKPNIPAGFDVSDRVELIDIRIVKSAFNQTPEINRGRKNVDIDRKVNLQIDKEKGVLFVVINFDLKASIDGVQSPVITIAASFLLVYRLQDFNGLTDESYRSFAEVNAVFNAWPYWREFVQNITVRMGLPPLTMPVFRIAGTNKKEIAENTNNNAPDGGAEKMVIVKRKKKIKEK